jgi:hypothetical protein
MLADANALRDGCRGGKRVPICGAQLAQIRSKQVGLCYDILAKFDSAAQWNLVRSMRVSQCVDGACVSSVAWRLRLACGAVRAQEGAPPTRDKTCDEQGGRQRSFNSPHKPEPLGANSEERLAEVMPMADSLEDAIEARE